MDREAFRARLEELDPDDEAGLVEAIRTRVSALSGRHLDIQDRIEETNQSREQLQRRLEEVEAEIVRQADESVQQDLETIEDVEALPDDADVEFDPELVEEVQDIRERARENYQRTAEQGSDLQAELNENTDELELYGDVLAEIESGTTSAAEARERLLSAFDEE